MYTMYLYDEEKGVWEYDVFIEFAKYLRSRGQTVTIEEVNSFELKFFPFFRKQVKLHHALALIQNDKTGEFYALDGNDWVTPFSINLKDFVRDERCQVMLKCQYRWEPYATYPLTKIRPWTYFEMHSSRIQPRLSEYRRKRRTRDMLFFRGNTAWEGRGPILECLKGKGIVNSDYSTWVPYERYLQESCDHKMVLGLPGMGHICHREIEAFGVGTPVLMPRLKVKLHNDLIPDHHYISIAVDTLQDGAYYVADKIEERWRQVAQDQEYLGFVARNAIQWYDENVRFPNSLELTMRLLGIRC